MSETLTERLTAAIYDACKERAEWSGSYLTDRHPETGVFNFDGEIPVPEIIKHFLTAMRETTDNQLVAGANEVDRTNPYDRDIASNIWTAMIDAALAEEGP